VQAQRRTGSFMWWFFQHADPQLRFTPAEQDLLVLALRNLSDADAAARLHLSPHTVAMRWRSLLARASEHRPDLFPPHDGVSRGPERRSTLLAWLRQHPEELRPRAAPGLIRCAAAATTRRTAAPGRRRPAGPAGVPRPAPAPGRARPRAAPAAVSAGAGTKRSAPSSKRSSGAPLGSCCSGTSMMRAQCAARSSGCGLPMSTSGSPRARSVRRAPLPVRPGGCVGTVDVVVALRAVELQHGGTAVARVQLDALEARVVQHLRHAHAQALHMGLAALGVVGVEDGHVATQAATALQEATGRRAFVQRCHHLHELVAEDEERVLQTVGAHRRVAVAHGQPEQALQRLHGRLQHRRHQADLSQPQGHATASNRAARSKSITQLTSQWGATVVGERLFPARAVRRDVAPGEAHADRPAFKLVVGEEAAPCPSASKRPRRGVSSACGWRPSSHQMDHSRACAS
jgi:hypothetical protein